MVVEPLAGSGRQHASRLTQKEHRAEPAFEAREVVAQRGLGDVARPCGARQVALLVDGGEIAKRSAVHGCHLDLR
ncbi:MAG TPA: hypothetical protein VLE23_05285, partial [Geminicoccaceae bacterium]|nr:hypothetical protein [Geminicoccaceae bacterium]